jgi:hypothetical protein
VVSRLNEAKNWLACGWETSLVHAPVVRGPGGPCVSIYLTAETTLSARTNTSNPAAQATIMPGFTPVKEANDCSSFAATSKPRSANEDASSDASFSSELSIVKSYRVFGQKKYRKGGKQKMTALHAAKLVEVPIVEGAKLLGEKQHTECQRDRDQQV